MTDSFEAVQTSHSLLVKDVHYTLERDGARRPLFAGLSFEIDSHTICALIGESGVGKSTLLKIISGELSPQSGSIRGPSSTMGNGRILYHAQDPMLLPWLTVRQNLSLGFSLAGLPPVMALETIEERLGLSGLSSRFPMSLSGGETERVALGRSLLTPADVYLLDEPISGTHYQRRLIIEQFLKTLAIGGRVLIVTTHDLLEALAVSAFVLVLAPSAGGHRLRRIDFPPTFAALSPSDRRTSGEVAVLLKALLKAME